MFKRTAQPALWFIAGSLAQCRIYSRYLGLQIKACEAGLLPRVRARPDSIVTGSPGNSHQRLKSAAAKETQGRD